MRTAYKCGSAGDLAFEVAISGNAIALSSLRDRHIYHISWLIFYRLYILFLKLMFRLFQWLRHSPGHTLFSLAISTFSNLTPRVLLHWTLIYVYIYFLKYICKAIYDADECDKWPLSSHLLTKRKLAMHTRGNRGLERYQSIATRAVKAERLPRVAVMWLQLPPGILQLASCLRQLASCILDVAIDDWQLICY